MRQITCYIDGVDLEHIVTEQRFQRLRRSVKIEFPYDKQAAVFLYAAEIGEVGGVSELVSHICRNIECGIGRNIVERMTISNIRDINLMERNGLQIPTATECLTAYTGEFGQVYTAE